MSTAARLEREKEKAQSSGDLKQFAALSSELGEFYAQQGDYVSALAEHQGELAASEALGDGVRVGVAHRRIGECHAEQGEYARALEHQQLHLEAAREAGDLMEEQRAQATLGRTHLYRAEVGEGDGGREALRHAQEAFTASLGLCEQLRGAVAAREGAEMRARLWLNLGLVHESRGDVTRCVGYIKRAIQSNERYSLHEDAYRCQLSLAAVYQRQTDPRNAIRPLQVALQCAHKLHDRQRESEVLTQQATLFLQLGDFLAARRHARKAYRVTPLGGATRLQTKKTLKTLLKISRLCEELDLLAPDDWLMRMRLYEKVADYAAKIVQFQLAIEHYQKMLQCAEKLQQPASEMIPIHASLAQTYVDLGQHHQAAASYRDELKCQPARDHKQLCRTWLDLAGAAERDGEAYPALMEMYSRATAEAEGAANTGLQVEVLRSCCVVQKRFGDAEGRLRSERQIALLRPAGSSPEPDSSDDSQRVSDSDDDSLVTDLSESDGSNDDEEFDRESRSPANKVTGVGVARRCVQFKRNEKGETPLHRACIDGKLKKVQELLNQGHPVNPRDYCGWLPLHEAANHGHDVLVDLLLSRGAAIDDRGGALCGGVTPLMDAAAAGNTVVVRLLVTRGATVTARDNGGRTVLDALAEYKRNSQGDLDSEELADLHETRLLLQRSLGAVKSVKSGDLTSGAKRTLTNRSGDLTSGAKRTLTNRSGDLTSGAKRTLTNRSGDLTSGAKRTMTKQNGDLTTHVVEHSPTNQQARTGEDELTNQQARTGEDELTNQQARKGVDSEDELPDISPVKRRPSQLSSRSDSQSEVTPEPEMTPEPDASPEPDMTTDPEVTLDPMDGPDRSKGGVRHPPTGEVESASDCYREAIAAVGSASKQILLHPPTPSRPLTPTATPAPLLAPHAHVGDDWLIDDVSRPTKRQRVTVGSPTRLVRLHPPRAATTKCHSRTTRQAAPPASRRHQPSMRAFVVAPTLRDDLAVPTLPDDPVMTSALPPPGRSPSSLAMRLCVKIAGKRIMVPVLHSIVEPTIEWLALQAADRYFKLYNLRPVLSLATQDGAMLASDDVVTTLLSNNEELLAVVTSWDLPVLTIRYSEACEILATARCRDVTTKLQQCSVNGCFDLGDLSLTLTLMRPVIRVLRCEKTLTQLTLAGNRLSDSGLHELCDVASTLPQLTLLDLACTGLTHTALKSMADALLGDAQHRPFQRLQTLIMSYNALGDEVVSSLATILQRLPLLVTLRLASCELSAKFFEHHRILLKESFHAHHLNTLDLSHNTLGARGIDLLLHCLCRPRLRCLNVSANVTCHRDQHLLRQLTFYAAERDCVIESLLLEDSCLDADIVTDDLCSLVSGAPSLRLLSLSDNPRLDVASVARLLTAAAEGWSSHLTAVHCHGCRPNPASLALLRDALHAKLHHAYPLRELTLSADAEVTRMTSDLWRGRWGEAAILDVDAKLSLIQFRVKSGF